MRNPGPCVPGGPGLCYAEPMTRDELVAMSWTEFGAHVRQYYSSITRLLNSRNGLMNARDRVMIALDRQAEKEGGYRG